MKTIASLFLCMATLFSYAQKGTEKKVTDIYKKEGTWSWLDTSNMFTSRYGPVARLTLDNMPCIIPHTTTKPIPNTGKRKQIPNDIPNFWKREPFIHRSQPPVEIQPTLKK